MEVEYEEGRYSEKAPDAALSTGIINGSSSSFEKLVVVLESACQEA